MAEKNLKIAVIGEPGKRLDHVLQERLPQYSRSRLQAWIKEGRVRVDGAQAKPSLLLRGGEAIEVAPGEPPPLQASAEDLPLEVLYESGSVVVVNKPAGVVVHAGAGHHSGTLVNALLHHFGKLSEVGDASRPGIVHRIDRYTSGVLIVARTDAAHRALAEQFAARTVEKTYLTLVEGVMEQDSGRVLTPITRDPVRRTRMTTKLGRGRSAVTSWRILKRFEKFSYLEVKIGTGRTHQIRVHIASIGHPVAGDTLYGAARAPYGRYFLHAAKVGFNDPETGQHVEVTAGFPRELTDWLDEVAL